jgi:hypothetical protein
VAFIAELAAEGQHSLHRSSTLLAQSNALSRWCAVLAKLIRP